MRNLYMLLCIALLNMSALVPVKYINTDKSNLKSTEIVLDEVDIKSETVDTLETVHPAWSHNLHDHLFDVRQENGKYIVNYDVSKWKREY